MRILLFSGLLLAAILLPFFLWEGPMNELAAKVLSKQVPALAVGGGVVALLVADVVLPIPSSIVSTSAGALLGFWAGFAAVWTGMTLGCIAGYLLGRFAHAFVRKHILDAADIARIRESFERSGGWVIVSSRPLPVLAETVTLMAGVIKAPFGTFIALSAATNLALAAVYAAAGAAAYSGESITLWIAAGLGIPWVARAVHRRVARKRAAG